MSILSELNKERFVTRFSVRCEYDDTGYGGKVITTRTTTTLPPFWKFWGERKEARVIHQTELAATREQLTTKWIAAMMRASQMNRLGDETSV